MSKGLLLILLIIYIRNSACVIDVLYDIGKNMWTLYSIIDEIRLEDSQNAKPADKILDIYNSRNQEIENITNKIHEQLDRIEKLMYSKKIRDSLKFTSADAMLSQWMDKIEIYVLSIDEYYKYFYEHMSGANFHARHQNYIFSLGDVLNIQGYVTMIRKIIINAETDIPDHMNLVTGITGFATSLHTQLCGGPQIVSDILVQLFRMVVLAEIKASVIMAFANLYIFMEAEGWKTINFVEKIIFGTYLSTYVNLFALQLDMTDALYLRACDPAGGIWIRDKSFYELEGMFQATIFRYHWGVCKYGSCNDILFIRPNRCESELYDQRTGCSGTMSRCRYLSAIQACVLRNGPYKFQYVNSTALGALGKNFECPKDNGYLIEDGTGTNIVYAACACNCLRSNNKISLSNMASQVSANKVITGLRLLRKNSILYIQPRQGKLSGNGFILRYSQTWVSIPDSPDTHPIDAANRVFFLDDVRLPPYYALTGVKFNKVTRGNITGFAIEIFGTPFDYKNGTLNSENALRISKEILNDELGDGLSFKKISSAHTTLRHEPSALNHKYLSLRQSELSDDFGQATLPLFDAVPIESMPPAILNGVGIFHKGAEGHAGFVSLRLYGLKYAKYFYDFEESYMPDNGPLSFNISIPT